MLQWVTVRKPSLQDRGDQQCLLRLDAVSPMHKLPLRAFTTECVCSDVQLFTKPRQGPLMDDRQRGHMTLQLLHGLLRPSPFPQIRVKASPSFLKAAPCIPPAVRMQRTATKSAFMTLL